MIERIQAGDILRDITPFGSAGNSNVRRIDSSLQQAVDLTCHLDGVHFRIRIHRSFFTDYDKSILSETLQDLLIFGAAIGRVLVSRSVAFDKLVVQKEKVSGIGLVPGIYYWRKAGKDGKEG